jgi:recombination protein RecA
MEENTEFKNEIEKLVREKLDTGAVVSANSVAPVDLDVDVDDEDVDDDRDVEELEEI